ncbi:MAG TPA: hypothetical protein PKC43_08545 [Phycisphaerales bacterium]|nr:hypothetical protein [Phycisphaerales bacterium]HMP37483.1 hypothetical protein [Phycisphaerales bacterium]
MQDHMVGQSLVVSIVLSMSAPLLAVPLPCEAATSPPSKADILEIVAANRAAMLGSGGPISFAFAVDVAAAPVSHFPKEVRHVAFDQDGMSVDTTRWTLDGKSFRVRHVQDGDSVAQIDVAGSVAIVFETLSGEALRKLGNPFVANEMFWQMRQIPVAPEGAAHPADLAAILESPQWVLRPAFELIESTPCVVLDQMVEGFDAPAATLWLDPAAGYLPRLQRSFGLGAPPNGSGVVLASERGVAEFGEFGGIMLPLRGWMRAPHNGGSSEIDQTIEASFELIAPGSAGWDPAWNAPFAGANAVADATHGMVILDGSAPPAE